MLRVRVEHPSWGARKIRAVLETQGIEVPSVSTVHAILVRDGRVDPATAAAHRP